MSVFEAIMVVSFGLAWPATIIKSLRTKSAQGKSFVFSVVILIGYMAGIIHKIIYDPDIVLLLYCINLCMVSVDFALNLHYHKLDKQKAAQSTITP